MVNVLEIWRAVGSSFGDGLELEEVLAAAAAGGVLASAAARRQCRASPAACKGECY